MTDDEFCAELQAGLQRGDLSAVVGHPIATVRAAEALCAALRAVMPGSDPIRLESTQPFRVLLHEFQKVTTREADQVIRERGVPLLIELSQRALVNDRSTVLILMAMRLLAFFCTEAGTREVARQARAESRTDEYGWSVVCSIFASDQREHPYRHLFCDELRDPLPRGYLGLAYLYLANTLARREPEFRHPFDRPEGYERLRSYLTSTNPDDVSDARSATAALPFISRPQRDELFALAMDHASIPVQIEAAWAAGRLGSESGIRVLARFALDPHHAAVACHYLTELGREDAIPAEARDPDFQALAEMSQWLQHPTEFGRIPDELEIFDTRTLVWPPTNDERRLWLIKYRFRKLDTDPDDDDEDTTGEPQTDDVGLGMVGSVTFALFGETTAHLKPLEAYALHCCWELETNKDPRAPRKRSIAAGLALLEQANQTLRD